MNRYILLLLFLLTFPISLQSQNADWVQANPNPQNDFYAIKFFNQTTGYVIGSGGVILKNTTGTNNWTTIPSGTVNDLYGMYFFDVNHGYIVGAGGLIMYTSDGGSNWTHLVTSNGFALRSITFVNQNTGFIVGDHGELYRTTTGLYGWMSTSITSKNLRSVAAPDSTTVFVCGDSAALFRSINGGNNWNSLTVSAGNFQSVYFINAMTGFLTRNDNGLNKTIDGGNTWAMLNWYGSGYSIKFLNANTGFGVGQWTPIMKTTNGGTGWSAWCSSQLFPGNTFLDICPVDSNHAYTCGTRGWILKSVDSGNFVQNSYSLGGTRFTSNSISFVNANTGGMVVNSQYLYTSNGGLNWVINLVGSNSWFEGSSVVNGARLFPPNSGYRTFHNTGVTYYSDYIQNSTDGGLTWNGGRTLDVPLGPGFSGYCEAGGVTYVLIGSSQVRKNPGSGWTTVLTSSNNSLGGISFADANTGIVGGGGSVMGVSRTTDGGNTWAFIPTGNTHRTNKAVLRQSGTGFIAGDSLFVMRTYDFGANWTLLSQNGNQYIQDIYFATDNIGWYLAQTGNYPNYTKRLFYTDNGGTNFQQLQSLMNFNVNGFSFVDANTGYVCGDSGVVLKTTNGGITFVNPALENLPLEFSLSQNYPNPFNPTTTIKFDIPVKSRQGGTGSETSNVKLVIYEVTGRIVNTLINQQLQPGTYSVNWDASNYPSGVYFYKLEAESFNQSRKMVLIK